MKVSIIIPVLNEISHITDCLESVLNQDYPQDKLEILVCDGGSTDGTREIIETYCQQYPNMRLFNNKKRITPSAMNLGIINSSGDLIIRVDAHANYAKDYIAKCVEWSKKTGADNVGGPACAKGEGLWGKAIELAHYSPFGLGGASFRVGNYEGYADTVFGGAFKREVFDKVGLYDERLVRNQDIELNSRIISSGGTCYLTPEIRSTYYCRSNLKDLWQQNYNNGLWSIYTRKISKQALSLRHFVPFLFVLGLILSAISMLVGWLLFRSLAWWFTLPLILCAGSYIFASMFFATRIAHKNRLKYLIPLLAVFATLHISYGWGSMVGVFTVNKWVRENQTP